MTDDVYTGGQSEDKVANDVELALTQYDEFGRVLTPKERWRRLNHKCVLPSSAAVLQEQGPWYRSQAAVWPRMCQECFSDAAT